MLSLPTVESARLSEHSASNSSKNFKCPSQCQECCTAHWAKTFVGNWGTSGKRFKCIPKKNEVPTDRACTSPEERSHSRPQVKVECDYTQEEMDAEIWDDLDEKCSKYSKCCCDTDEDWTERVCLGLDIKSKYTREISPKSQIEETYLIQPQTFNNRNEACKDPRHQALEYQTGKRSSFRSSGCCLRTERKSTRERYSCGRTCTGSRTRICRTRYCHRTIYWTGCAEWEELFYCSKDDGLTQSGSVYKRISSKTGMCLGDQSNLERLVHTHGWNQMEDKKNVLKNLKLKDGECPAGYKDRVAGEKCVCPTTCGSGYYR